MPEIMTIEELVEYLRLPSPETPYKWRQTNTGPKAMKVGRYLRYRKADVDAWLDQQAQPRSA